MRCTRSSSRATASGGTRCSAISDPISTPSNASCCGGSWRPEPPDRKERSVEIKRLDLGHLVVATHEWPVHGYVILHDRLGVILVDTGCGGPDDVLRYYKVVNRTVANALAEHGLAPIDVTMVINTHLHFDHCGQNPAFAHAPLMVQRSEHERILRERDEVTDWIEASGMEFELGDGDVVLGEDLRIAATPGHTSGHQSVIATTHLGTELFI